jgi:hypothetical protein
VTGYTTATQNKSQNIQINTSSSSSSSSSSPLRKTQLKKWKIKKNLSIYLDYGYLLFDEFVVVVAATIVVVFLL